MTSKRRTHWVAVLVAVVVIGFGLADCVTPASTMCADGLVCPPNSQCDDVNHRCLGANFCGDGLRTGSEVCEGNDLAGQTCKSLGFRGETTGLKCSADCTFDKSGCFGRCGDGVIDSPDEQCDGAPPAGKTCLDYGYDSGFLGCSELCQPSVAGCEKVGWKVVVPSVYNAIWGTSSHDVFAVGKDIVHWDGVAWSTMKAPPAPSLVGAHSASGPPPTMGGAPPGAPPSTDYFGGMNYPDGWTAVWGSGPNDVWVVGGLQILHWDGATWSSGWMPPLDPTFQAEGALVTADTAWRLGGVWGTGPRDVYAFGAFAAGVPSPTNVIGQLFHWNGSKWSQASLPIPAGDWIQGMGGSGPNDVYVLTGGEGALHWDGTRWGAIQISPTQKPSSIWAIWASAANDVYAVGPTETDHWDGSSWAPVPNLLGGASVWGRGPQDVFIESYPGVVTHWDGVAWSKVYQNEGKVGGRLGGVWGAGSLESTWILVGAGIMQPSRMLWFAEPDTGGSVWGTGEDVFELIMNGPALPAPPPPVSSSPQLRHVRKGTPSTLIPIPFNLQSLWGSASNDLWASSLDCDTGVCDYGVWRWNGFSWAQARTFGLDGGVFPSAFGGSSSSDVWAIGANGMATHWDGRAWSSFVGPGASKAIWSRSSTDAFAVGDAGAISHWNGVSWTAMPSGTPEDLTDVWGAGSEVFAVGKNGTILHIEDGTRWTPMASGTTSDLRHVRASSAGNVFVTADDRLLHLRAGAWEPIAGNGDALWVTPTSVYVVMSEQDPQGVSTKVSRLDLLGVNCQSPETDCTDGWDNDCDGLQDGADPDCAGKVVEQQCANLVDDDGDGLVDCADPNCATFSRCRKP